MSCGVRFPALIACKGTKAEGVVGNVAQFNSSFLTLHAGMLAMLFDFWFEGFAVQCLHGLHHCEIAVLLSRL